jgi:murein tripeptide amidase MpaA
LGGLPVELVTITAYNDVKYSIDKRKVIVITARVHAAEVAGSFEMEGILRFLTGKSKKAVILRRLYIFKLIPMRNPEGVVCGNYRCSFTRTDLNRRWDSPGEHRHPQIYHLKNLIRTIISESKEILAFCDLHERVSMEESLTHSFMDTIR